MISYIARHITQKLCDDAVIDKEDEELYDYGFFMFLSQTAFLLVTVLFGWIWRGVWESIVFYVVFSLLRGYAGGYHASKEITCTIVTACSVFVCVMTIFWLKRANAVLLSIVLLLVNSIIIFRLSPLDTEEKTLNTSERNRYRQVTHRVLIAVLICVALSCLSRHYGIIFCVSVAVTMESILLLLGWRKRKLQVANM